MEKMPMLGNVSWIDRGEVVEGHSITTRVFMESTVEQQFDGCIEEDEKQLWGFYLLIGEKETNTQRGIQIINSCGNRVGIWRVLPGGTVGYAAPPD